MTKVAIISDTHLKDNMKRLQSLVETRLQDVDIIIHTGDFTSMKVVEYLKNSCKRFIGVYGNNDGSEIRDTLKREERVIIEGYRIGIIHGDNGNDKNTEEFAVSKFKDEGVDIIIFGHTHKSLIKSIGKVLILNAGSPFKRFKEKWYSYIILNLSKEDGIYANINFYK